MRPEEIRSWLKKARVFELASEEALSRLSGKVRVVRWARGKKILRTGDTGSAMMIVIQGRVKITACAANGRERILNIIEPGETLGEMAVLDGDRRSADAEALEETVTIAVAREDFDAMLDSDPRAARRIIVELCSKLRRSTALVEDTLFVSSEARLARRVKALADPNGEHGDGTRTWSLEGFSQQELADAVGVSRESVNRLLRRWQALGIVSLGYRTVVVEDIARLERLAREQETTDGVESPAAAPRTTPRSL